MANLKARTIPLCFGATERLFRTSWECVDVAMVLAPYEERTRTAMAIVTARRKTVASRGAFIPHLKD
jgi:hypothetical protein